jgi:fatty acid desaturase
MCRVFEVSRSWYYALLKRGETKRQRSDKELSRTGCCYDNAITESFFGTLKRELVHHCSFATRQDAQSRIFRYIEGFYNRRRRHSAIGYQTPERFEQAFLKMTGFGNFPCPLLRRQLICANNKIPN